MLLQPSLTPHTSEITIISVHLRHVYDGIRTVNSCKISIYSKMGVVRRQSTRGQCFRGFELVWLQH